MPEIKAFKTNWNLCYSTSFPFLLSALSSQLNEIFSSFKMI